MQQVRLNTRQRAASFPLSSILGGRSSTVAEPREQLLACTDLDKTSQTQTLSPFSPLFNLELEAKLAASSNNLDRCFSDQQFRNDGNGLLQQILMLCRCTSPIEAQLLQQLQWMRTQAATSSSCNGPEASSSTSSTSSCTSNNRACVIQQALAASFLVPESSLDIESMACELLAEGYLVQVRQQQHDGRPKTARSCLQNLRHRFIVCLGWRSSADAEPLYLPEPLVVEPRFREQFAIAHPTAEYEMLLQSVPPCFVGPVSNLEGIVKLLNEQMIATFKAQGLSVPPWRTRAALLSKWSPTQLADLAAKIASMRRAMAVGRAVAPCQSHERLCNGDRPAAVHTLHAAVGSAPSVAMHSSSSQVAQTAAATVVGEQQSFAGQRVLAVPPADVQLELPQTRGARQASGAQYSVHHTHESTSEAACRDLPRPEQKIAATGLLASGSDAYAAVLPVGMSNSDNAEAVRAASGAPNLQALLQAAEGLGGSPSLKFTRKASSEWKHQHNRGEIKGLLATALKRTVGPSRSNLGSGACSAASVECTGVPPPADLTQQVNNSALVAQPMPGPAAPSAIEIAAQHVASDALIRRTHYRATGDEPWRRITTVKWGACAQQQAPQQQASHTRQS